ncbi:uncharacterized protein LAESUDRAFT_760528 [Laetiporus sulphureus 93-53]|uniref:F-box domain-containing protein n=1 Tax=Laetiporus sulphureus 93-53 TaxID=1314785 RepID=A0A165DKA2_9APHY|nr:uncharacterized protein LAESUDRAFT_760528 [Laetiporus sulphureus 93-53]KZT05068.1 hypothetical protein LAESUDRAFT_760528 [Laetiporus sulphureus 93-53]
MAAATTHAMSNPDLVREIIQYLSPKGTEGDVTRTNIHALVCCSRVNKTFSVNALDLLWEQLDSLLPVLKLLPSFVLKERHLQDELTDFSDDEEDTETDMDDYELIYYLQDIPTAQEWAHLQQYAERVRLLELNSESSTLPAVLSLLYYHNGGRFILPRLECLDWRITSISSSTVILALVPTSLRTLTIDFLDFAVNLVDDTVEGDPCEAATIGMLWRFIVAAVPGLEEVTLLDIPPSFELMPIIKCTQLRSLNLGDGQRIGVDGILWRALSSLSALEAITGNFNLLEDLHEGEEGFFALRKLALCGCVRDVNCLIDTISSRHLEYFSYELPYDEENLTAYLLLLTNVCTKFGASLRVFMTNITFDAASVASLNSFGRVMQPLFSLRTLEDISFTFHGCSLPLSDKDMREIAKAFPELKAFTLIVTDRMHETVPSIEAFMEFARRCPRLKYLRLPAIHFANLSTKRKFRHTSHGLQRLIIGQPGFRMQKPGAVARFLDAVFPNMEADETLHGFTDSVHDTYGWDTVVPLLKARQASRRSRQSRESELKDDSKREHLPTCRYLTPENEAH